MLENYLVKKLLKNLFFGEDDLKSKLIKIYYF